MSDLRPMDGRDEYQLVAKAAQMKIKRALRDGDVRPGLEDAAKVVRDLLGEVADMTFDELRELLAEEDEESQ